MCPAGTEVSRELLNIARLKSRPLALFGVKVKGRFRFLFEGLLLVSCKASAVLCQLAHALPSSDSSDITRFQMEERCQPVELLHFTGSTEDPFP